MSVGTREETRQSCSSTLLRQLLSQRNPGLSNVLAKPATATCKSISSTRTRLPASSMLSVGSYVFIRLLFLPSSLLALPLAGGLTNKGSTAMAPISSRTHLQTRARDLEPSEGSMEPPMAARIMEYVVESGDRIGLSFQRKVSMANTSGSVADARLTIEWDT